MDGNISQLCQSISRIFPNSNQYNEEHLHKMVCVNFLLGSFVAWFPLAEVLSMYQEVITQELMRITVGPPDRLCSLNKLLTSEELILSMLRHKKLIDYLSRHLDFSARVSKTLLTFSRIPWAILNTLVSDIFQSSYSNKEELKQFFWDQLDCMDIPPEFGLLLLKEDPNLLQNFIMNLYLNYRGNETHLLWNQCKYERLVKWSCKSAEIFQMISSLFNEILIHSKYKQIVLKVINRFVSDVSLGCQKDGELFISLYPVEFQSLVALLELEPELNPCCEEIRLQLKYLIQSRPYWALIFLSHFPDWTSELG